MSPARFSQRAAHLDNEPEGIPHVAWPEPVWLQKPDGAYMERVFGGEGPRTILDLRVIGVTPQQIRVRYTEPARYCMNEWTYLRATGKHNVNDYNTHRYGVLDVEATIERWNRWCNAPLPDVGRLGTPTRLMADLAALCSRYDATIKATRSGGVKIILRTPEGRERIDLTYTADGVFPKAGAAAEGGTDA